MTEKQLLFAVLAFESELIDLVQLTSACHAWAVDKSQPLAEMPGLVYQRCDIH